MADDEAIRQVQTERELEARSGEAAAVQKQSERVARAEERRAEQRDEATEGGIVAGERGSRRNPSYNRERLIAEADAIAGVPSHVMAGALHAHPREFLTADQAKKAVEDFLGREVVTG